MSDNPNYHNVLVFYLVFEPPKMESSGTTIGTGDDDVGVKTSI